MSDWTLGHGDCIEGMRAMADRSVDCAIFDPPYAAKVHAKSMRGANGWKGEISVVRDLGFASLTAKTMRATSKQLARLVARWVAVFCDVESSHLWSAELERVGLDYVRTCAWIKIGGAPQFTGDRPAVAFEAIVLAHQPGKKQWNGGGKAGVYSYPIVLERGGNKSEARVHTTQKAEALMEALVKDFTNPGDLILDPFAGSGTTGVAALRSGRRFVGFEQDANYHAIASKRLGYTREQTRLAL